MSKLRELIQQLCPDGIEYKAIGECCNVNAGGDVPKDSFSENCEGKYTIPIISNGIGENSLYGYTDVPKVIGPAVTVAARGTIGYAEYRNYSYFPIIRLLSLSPKDLTKLDTKFLYYALQGRKYTVPTTGIPQLTAPNIKKEKVPLPPLPIQQEIVRILDSFTELTAELTAEQKKKKKQYEYYRDELLHKNSFSDVRKCKLGEVADIHTGSKPDEILEDYSEFEYINAGTANSGYVKTPNCPGDTVTTPSRGQGGIGFVGYQSQPFHLGPLCYSIRSNDENIVTNKFIYYWLSSHAGDILAFKKEGGTPALNRGDLMGLRFCVPHISVQHRIVCILDRFDALCNDLTSGLPAEIEARKKQYEYYRDKLLSFKVKA